MSGAGMGGREQREWMEQQRSAETRGEGETLSELVLLAASRGREAEGGGSAFFT